MSEKEISEKKKTVSSKEFKNLLIVFNVLKQHPGGLWIREISRRGKLHMEVVRRIIAKHATLFENYADFTGYNINLKIFKLRNPNMTHTAIENYLKLKAQ
ncbi:MAG: hypothetical protein K0B02_00875 [DPANN group archaeon]|nr:hypothetical protein [DPANN group archaeon]